MIDSTLRWYLPTRYRNENKMEKASYKSTLQRKQKRFFQRIIKNLTQYGAEV